MRFLIVIAALAAFASPTRAHEFWISPEAYQVDVGTPLAANIRVGESFKGNAYSYFPRNTARFEVALGAALIDPAPITGDRPVLNAAMPSDGLAIVIFETTDSRLTYREWEKFVAFVDHKAFDGALAAHTARGLPETGFVETYRRYAKSLLAVGDGAGSDRAVGLDTEIVALANPYTDALGGEIAVQVLLYGAPRANAQVETYARSPEGEISVTLTRTDSDGKATLTALPGFEYMVDAVVLEPREGEAAWHSMWANLTFAVPAR